MEKKNMKYYENENDTIFAVDENNKTYIFNIKEKRFIPTKITMDIMTWHEISELNMKMLIKFYEDPYQE